MDDVRMTPRLTFGDPLPPADRNLCASLVRGRDGTGALTPVRIQRQRRPGWRMPEGAVYVGRPTLFGNPFPTTGRWVMWTAVALGFKADAAGRRDASVTLYRAWMTGALPLQAGHRDASGVGAIAYSSGLVAPIDAVVQGLAARMARGMDLPDRLADLGVPPDIAPLRDATALACWCPLVDAEGRPVPCHADVLIELLAGMP